VVRILVSADMEGATGVTWPADVEPGTAQWQRARVMFTSDVNAAVAGFLDGGAEHVLVNEAHATMRNLLLEELDPRAGLLTGRHKDLSMVEGIQDPPVAGVAFVGYHTGAGADGVLSHTYLANSITGVWVDGEPASEGRLNALVAAEYGVPVILVTGDDRTCAEAAGGTAGGADGYAPGAVTVAVKDCVSRYAAVCRPPRVTHAAIRAAAKEAMSLAGRRPRVEGCRRDVEVEFDAAHLAGAASIVPGVRRTGVRRVAYRSDSAYDLIRCFKVVATMAYAAAEAHYG
jgi:D-amino peptidase